MNQKCLSASRRSGLLVLRNVIAFVLAANIVFGSLGHGATDIGHVAGTVTVFQKRLFGKLKKKKDMSGVLVYITGFKSEAPEGIPDLVQKNKHFQSVVLPVVMGQKVCFPNYDDIYHNVFSISTVKSFDLGQYKSNDTPKIVVFEKVGLVPVYCNIHPQMIACIVVLENSAYAMTDKDGSFKIMDVPIGAYTVNAWLPRAKRVSQEVQIQAGQRSDIHLELSEIVKRKGHKRKDGSKYPPRKGRSKY